MKNVLPIKPCLARKNVRVLHGECRQQILYLMLISKCLSNNLLFWHTGKFTASKIVESGRSKLKQQIEAVKKKRKEKKSFSCLYMKNNNRKIPRISPESNVEIDRVWCKHSKILPSNLLYICKKNWNTMTVDYFLFYKSLKCSRFNGRHFLLSIG